MRKFYSIDIISEQINEVPELVDKGKLYNPIVITNKKLIEAFSQASTARDLSSHIGESACFIKWLEMGVRGLSSGVETFNTGRPLREVREYEYLRNMHENCMEKYGNRNLIPIAERLSQDIYRKRFDGMIDLSLDVIRIMYEDPNSNAYEKNTLLRMQDIYKKFYAPAIPLYKAAGEKIEKFQSDFYKTFLNDVENNRKNGIVQKYSINKNTDEPSMNS